MRRALIAITAVIGAILAAGQGRMLLRELREQRPVPETDIIISHLPIPFVSSDSFSSFSLASFDSFPSSPSSRSSPASLRISVPFSPQAPFAVWDPLHEEACEEMALIMVARFWEQSSLSREEAERELLSLINWEEEHGYGVDVTMQELAEIARGYYGLSARVETDVTAASIKEHLADGKPVIIPAAGRDLGNPYFSGEGPWYHALVITGYDGKGNFITNDPGTKRGEHYLYPEQKLLSVIHDWTGVKEEIRKGRKAIVMVER